MPRIPVHTTESVPQAASQLTEFTSSLQSAVPWSRRTADAAKPGATSSSTRSRFRYMSQ
jgi:hypothetical protein